MADRDFQIKITTLADTAGARQTADALKATGHVGSEETKKISAETEKLTLKKTELRHIIRHISAEFPLLGAAARLVLNPIVGIVVLATFAVRRLAESWKDMHATVAGAELPQVTREQVAQISGAAEAWQKYADGVERARREMDSIAKFSDEKLRRIAQTAGLAKELISGGEQLSKAEVKAAGAKGFIGPAEALGLNLRAEIEAERARRKADLAAETATIDGKLEKAVLEEQDSKKKEAEAMSIRVATAAQDSETEQKLKSEAETASKDLERRRATLKRLTEPSLLGIAQTAAEQIFWFGGMGIEDRKKALGTSITQDQAAISRYERFLRQKPFRERARTRREELLGAAGKETAEWEELFYNTIPAETEALQERTSVHEKTSVMGELGRAYEAQAQGETSVRELARRLADALQNNSADVKALANAMKAQRQVNDEVADLIAETRRRLANLR